MTKEEKEFQEAVNSVQNAGVSYIEDALKKCIDLAIKLQNNKADKLDILAKEVINTAVQKLNHAVTICNDLKEAKNHVKQTNGHLINVLCDNQAGVFFVPDSRFRINKNFIKLAAVGSHIVGLVNHNEVKIKYKGSIFHISSHNDLEYLIFPEYKEDKKDEVLKLIMDTF